MTVYDLIQNIRHTLRDLDLDFEDEVDVEAAAQICQAIERSFQ